MHAIPRLQAESAQTHVNLKELSDAMAAVGEDLAFLLLVVPKEVKLGEATKQFLIDKATANAAGTPDAPVLSAEDTGDGPTGKSGDAKGVPKGKTGDAKVPGTTGPKPESEPDLSDDDK